MDQWMLEEYLYHLEKYWSHTNVKLCLSYHAGLSLGDLIPWVWTKLFCYLVELIRRKTSSDSKIMSSEHEPFSSPLMETKPNSGKDDEYIG